MAIFPQITKYIGQLGYDEQIRNSLNSLSLLESTGLVWKGGFTPSGGNEYPSAPSFGWAYTIDGLTEGYTFTTGDLIGLTVYNGMTIGYSTAWLIASYDSLSKGDINGAIGRASTPIFRADIKNSFNLTHGVGSLTYDQPSDKTVINEYGERETNPSSFPDQPFGKNGFTCEVQSTNVLTGSTDMTTGWTFTRSSSSTDGTKGADGVTDMVKITEDGTASNTHLAIQPYSWTLGSWTTSIDFLAGSANRGIRLQFGGAAFLASDYIDIDENYTITIGATAVRARIKEYLSNGGVRIEITGTCDIATSANLNLLMLDTSINNVVYNGDSTSFVYVQFPQAEALPFATAHPPTTTAPATRLAQALSVPAKYNVPYLPDGATLRVRFTPGVFGDGIANKRIVSIRKDANNIVSLYLLANGQIGIQFADGGVNNGVTAVMASSLGDTITISVVFKTNGYYIYENGVLLISKLFTMTMPDITIQNIEIGSYSASTAQNYQGGIELVEWYDADLTAAEILLLDGVPA